MYLFIQVSYAVIVTVHCKRINFVVQVSSPFSPEMPAGFTSYISLTHNCYVLGICPSSGILKTRVSETRSASVVSWGGGVQDISVESPRKS
jgi:hypothetical protein